MLGEGHPSIVKYFDEFAVEQCGVIILEKLTKFTLEDLIRSKGRLQPREALSIFWEITSALEFMHLKHVRYFICLSRVMNIQFRSPLILSSPRDLKVENIGF